jgi:hypothetical protein
MNWNQFKHISLIGLVLLGTSSLIASLVRTQDTKRIQSGKLVASTFGFDLATCVPTILVNQCHVSITEGTNTTRSGVNQTNGTSTDSPMSTTYGFWINTTVN